MKKIFITLALLSFISSSTLAQWTTTSTNIYNTNTGNVGIGITNPPKKLSVEGNISVHDPSTTPDYGYYGGVMITKPAASAQYINLVRRNNVAWSIGMVYNTNTFAIGGGAYTADANFTPRFVINTSGYVGIGGITAPIHTLDVKGNINLTSTCETCDPKLLANNKAIISNFSGGNKIWINRNWASGTGFFSDYESIAMYGKVGINMDAPTSNLQVYVPLGATVPIKAVDINVQSFNTAQNATESYYLRLRDMGGNHDAFIVKGDGNVGIGTSSPGAKLDVIGKIRAHEVRVCLNQGCDFVFEPDYKLMPLNELNNFITQNKHLPAVAPAATMEAEGIDLSEMNAMLLQKVEELTLYVIGLNKRIQKLEEGE